MHDHSQLIYFFLVTDFLYFITPRMGDVLIANLLDPQPGMTIYDPAYGSAGLLIKCHLQLLES